MIRKLFIITGIFLALSTGQSFGKELKMAYDADPVTLDPHEQLSGGMLQLSYMLFDPLVRWTKQLTFEPRLAKSWQRIDKTTMRFFLRQGVKFHSGNEMTADDVIWTFKRLKKSSDFKNIFTAFESIKRVDDYTIDLVTNGPFPLTLHSATYIFPMDSQFYSGQDERGRNKDEIVKHGDSYASTNVSGTGPFIVRQREQGIRVEFERFADYWDKSSPGNVDKIILTPISEAPTRVAALLSGDVDFIAPVPPNDLKRVKNNRDTKLVSMGGTRIITMQLNQNRVAAFKDPRVRNAIAYAINNQAIVDKIMKGFASVAAQMSPPGYLGHNPELTPRYNLTKAKQLMTAAGYGDGLSVTMMCPNNRYVNDYKICEASATMLAKIGIKVDLTTMPKAQYWPKFDERAADMMMIGWHADTEDSANFYEFLAMTPNTESGRGQYNSGNYSNAEVDELTEASLLETDDERRSAILKEVEAIMYEEAAFIPYHWQNLAWAARKGVNIEPIVNVMNFPYLGDLTID